MRHWWSVTETGGSEIKSRGETDEASSSALFVFNPAEPHSGRMATSKRWRYRGLYLTQPALKKLGAALRIDALPYFVANVIRDRSLIRSFLDLHISLQNETNSLLERESFVASFGQLFRRYGGRGKRIPSARSDCGPVSSAQALMQDGSILRAAHSREMGQIVGLTPFQLIGLFKRAIGLTPHAYLTQVRLKAAIREM
jgi:hypothetical protein